MIVPAEAATRTDVRIMVRRGISGVGDGSAQLETLKSTGKFEDAMRKV